MATDERRCPGNGSEPCAVSSELLIQAEDGVWWCFGHHPRKAVERSAAGTLGGLKSAVTKRRGLAESELGKLESPEDAKRISARLTVAAATGELPAPQVNAALAALKQWLAAFEADVLDKRLDELEAAQKGRR